MHGKAASCKICEAVNDARKALHRGALVSGLKGQVCFQLAVACLGLGCVAIALWFAGRTVPKCTQDFLDQECETVEAPETAGCSSKFPDGQPASHRVFWAPQPPSEMARW